MRVLVAYYSQTGNTEKLAAAIAKGAASVKGVEVAVRKTAEVKDQEMLQADGILVGTPVQWANAATGAKQFLDRLGDAFWKAKAACLPPLTSRQISVEPPDICFLTISACG